MGLPTPVSVTDPPVRADMYWKVEFCRCQSRKLKVEMPFLASGSPGGFSRTRTILSTFAYGRGFKRTPSTKLKMAVFAPIPIASVRTATAVKPRLFRNVRKPYRRSCRISCTATLHVTNTSEASKGYQQKYVDERNTMLSIRSCRQINQGLGGNGRRRAS